MQVTALAGFRETGYVVVMSGNKDLAVVIMGIVGRKLPMGEIYDSLGLSSSAYYDQQKDGRLITADNLIRAARSFGINEVELLVAFDLLDPRDVVHYVEDIQAPFVGAARDGRGVATMMRPPNTGRSELAALSPAL